MTIEIADGRTEVVVSVAPDVFPTWFPVDAGALAGGGTFTPQQRAAIKGVLDRCLTVRIDGLEAESAMADPVLTALEHDGRAYEYVNLPLRFATAVPPRQVAFIWQGRAAADAYVFTDMDAELDAYGELLFPTFREEEPEFIWHRPVDAAPPAPAVLPPAHEPPHLTVPLVSVGLALAVLVCLSLLRPRPLPAGAALVLAGLLAFQLRDLVRVQVELPGDPGLVRPADEDAAAIFASLLRGVYTAVEREDKEAAVYDRLSESVTGELLPRLYLDIRQSMILRQEGGAVAKIRKTEILETTMRDDREEGAPWFQVRARWRVEGRVGHWGHTHQRINEYVADATVVADGGRWKIAQIDVLEETRVDDGEKVK